MERLRTISYDAMWLFLTVSAVLSTASIYERWHDRSVAVQLDAATQALVYACGFVEGQKHTQGMILGVPGGHSKVTDCARYRLNAMRHGFTGGGGHGV